MQYNKWQFWRNEWWSILLLLFPPFQMLHNCLHLWFTPFPWQYTMTKEWILITAKTYSMVLLNYIPGTLVFVMDPWHSRINCLVATATCSRKVTPVQTSCIVDCCIFILTTVALAFCTSRQWAKLPYTDVYHRPF